MFSVEGTKEEVLEYLRKLIVAAHKNNLKVSLDVNPMCFEKMGATPQDLSVFKSIDVDCLVWILVMEQKTMQNWFEIHMELK